MQRNNPARLTVSFRTKMTLVIFGFFAFFIFLETGVRFSGFMVRSVQEYRNRQSLQQKDTYRIMCLGESTTARQYPPYLEEILNQRHTGIHFSVIDKGIGGTNSAVILAQLESNLNQYHPDMVIAMMGINDGGIRYYKDIPEAGTKLFHYWKTYRLIRLLWVHILAKAKEEGSLKKAIALNPKNDRAYVELGQLYQAQDKLSQAEDSLKQAIALNPQSDRAYLRLGWFYQAQGKLSRAEDLLRKAIELNPQNDRAYVGLGWLYRAQGKSSQAEDAFKKAIALNPQNDGAYFELGWLYRAQGKSSQAEDAFKKAIALNPQNYRSYIMLGWVYSAQGKSSQAEDAFKKAIALNPKNDRAYIELWWIYRVQGKSSQAEDLFKKAIELNPQNDRAYGVLSAVYEEMGKPALAEEYAQKANRLRLEYYNPVIVHNYRTLKEILDKKRVRFVCVQYPMRSIEPLKKIFKGDEEGIIFVENAKIFREAVKQGGHAAYFKDRFAGDFGHCTAKGNRLLAENIANAILKEAFRDNF